MKTALITGHLGFVGRHIWDALAGEGWALFGMDIRDGAAHDCRIQFSQASHEAPQFDLVVHCAAVVGGRLTISNDPMAVAVDLELDAAMFRWAVRTHQRRVVYFSSSAAYPVDLQLPCHHLTEDDISPDILGVPDLTYGWAKLTGEYLAGFAEAEGVPVHVFRPFSGYGPRQALDYPFPAYVARAVCREDPFDVWGDGRQVRDFVHIDDIVATVLQAVDEDYREPLNIGTGVPTSFDALAHIVTRAVGYRPEIRHLLDAPTGPSYRVADVARLNAFRPPRISLDEGIARALAGR